MMFQLFNLTLVLSIGSGTPLFIAEYDPFCALQAYMEYPGVVSDIDIIVPSTGKFNITLYTT